MAVFSLEKLIACGGKMFLVFGCCGTLSPAIAIGDIILPTWSQSDEGTSAHYQSEDAAISTDISVQQALSSYLSENSSLTLHEGPLWTTDAPYRETPKKVNDFAAKGVLGVDMELSALAAVARFRGARLAAALVVSDQLLAGRWRNGYSQSVFRRNRRTLFTLLNRFLIEGGC